ncbi:hypothetical protein [Bacillus paranthracis]|uniref:hypothetical protein n=1 Tax=Bacillus paranthracis TaxID=2026186 RepID=UPI002FDBCE90|nr:hypothetical protein [Bacillus paranthracis]
MTNTFTKVELKAYPLLPQVESGMEVVALKDSDYKGLFGTIDAVLYGKDKETENDTVLDIVVTFKEEEGRKIEETHPHLNGTSICEVIMGEDELGFFFTVSNNLAQQLDGKYVCSACGKGMTSITEHQGETIQWTFEDGDYQKSITNEYSDGKKCGECGCEINDENEVFSY